MMHVVAYDISDEKIRNAIAKILDGYGERVQESVFECQLDAARHDDLTARLAGALGTEEIGNVRLYRLCADCSRASVGIGKLRTSAISSPVIVA